MHVIQAEKVFIEALMTIMTIMTIMFCLYGGHYSFCLCRGNGSEYRRADRV